MKVYLFIARFVARDQSRRLAGTALLTTGLVGHGTCVGTRGLEWARAQIY